MLSTEAINDALDETIRDLGAFMGRLFTKEIRDPKWAWPRDPSPRDIVDTGNLAKSLRIEVIQGPLGPEVLFIWTAPYAPPVHDGAVFKRTDEQGNPITMPARPWTRPVLYDKAKILNYTQQRFALSLRRRTA